MIDEERKANRNLWEFTSKMFQLHLVLLRFLRIASVLWLALICVYHFSSFCVLMKLFIGVRSYFFKYMVYYNVLMLAKLLIVLKRFKDSQFSYQLTYYCNSSVNQFLLHVLIMYVERSRRCNIQLVHVHVPVLFFPVDKAENFNPLIFQYQHARLFCIYFCRLM